MFALVQKKKEWERQNQQVLLRLVQTSADVSVESVKKAGLVTSFLVYLIYALIRGMLALVAFMFLGSSLIRRTAPELPPAEFYEFNEQHQLEKIKSSSLWR